MRVTEEYQARSRAVSKVTGEIAAQLELVSATWRRTTVCASQFDEG
jgi:hypothetical protein